MAANIKYISVACTVVGCNSSFRTRAEGGATECPACRSAHYYWRKRRPAQIVYRRERLRVFTNRLTEWFDKDGKKS